MDSADIVRKEYKISGMDCPDCALHLEKQLKKIPEMLDVKVNFLASKMEVSTMGQAIEDVKVSKIVETAGYKISDLSLIKTTLKVEGLDCSEDSAIIQKKLKKIDGIEDIQVNSVSGEIHITHSISIELIITNLREIGFDAHPAEKSSEEDKKNNRFRFTTALTGALIIIGNLLYYLSFSDFISLPIIFIGIIFGGHLILRKGVIEAKSLKPGINFLMTIAIIGAIIIGEYSEAGIVVFLFVLAQFLESYTMERARKSIGKLLEHKPKYANVLLNGKFIPTSVEQVEINQIVGVKPGDSIPVDGTIVKGKSYVDMSAITGEGIPIKKEKGDQVFAGTINKKGFIEVKVDCEYKDSTLSKIIRLVSEAQSQKAPKQAYIEKFSQYYTPLVIAIAFLVAILPPLLWDFAFIEWFYRSLVLLVISCPCALVLSTPITIVSGLTNAMRNGILIKGGVYLEKFAELNVIAFDKTGTLTEGQPSVQEVYPLKDFDKDLIISYAASLELRSEHPIAESIINFGEKYNAKLKDVSNFKSMEGKGIEGEIENRLFIIGNQKLFEERNSFNIDILPLLEKIEDANHTVVLFGNSEEVLGIISISDSIRESAYDTVKELKEEQIEKIVLVTGDNRVSAERVASSINMDAYYSGLLPKDKVDVIKKLREGSQIVAMVGDGVNDAPALAVADIGIALGASGTDVALETSDIALMKDELPKITYLRKLSRKTLRIVKQNIFISLALKFGFLILAIPGLATLWMAVFADMGASLIVIFNGMRALKKL